MSTEIANVADVPKGMRSLAARVREAAAQLAIADAVTVEVPNEAAGAVVVAHGTRKLAVVEAAAFVGGARWTEETIARAVVGDLALIVVGPLPDLVQPLLARGVYDAVDDDASTARLALSIRNALEMMELKDRAENRARWLRRYRNEASALIDTARALSQERDTTKLLEMILEKCRMIAGADAGSIYVVEGTDPNIEKRTLRFKLSQNESVTFPTGEFVIPVSMRSIAGAVAITRMVTEIDDVYNLPAGSPFAFDRSFDARVGYRTKSMLTVPLGSAEDEIIGVVQLINKKREPRARLRTPVDVDREVVPFDERSIELVSSLAAQAGIALENAMLYEEIRRSFEGFVHASVQAIEQRDPTTSGHSRRVSALSCRLADAVDRTDVGLYKSVRFSRQDLRELKYASLLHDFGKIGVREEVLVKAKKLYDPQLRLIRARFDYLHKTLEAEIANRRAELFARNAPVSELQALEVELARRKGEIDGYWKLIHDANEPSVLPQGTFERIDEVCRLSFTDPRGREQPWLSTDEATSLKVTRGSLSATEIEEIRSHVVHTFEFLSRIPWGKSFARVPTIAGCHHEKPNGRGYPRGLKGDEIPIASRVMAVADVFDALTASDRPYKKAVPVERALDILNLEVRDGGLDGELVRIFVDSGVYRAIDEPLGY
jgi:HD-GYP domain-containing protein (c-di-GMP phosphodiesterase class II)